VKLRESSTERRIVFPGTFQRHRLNSEFGGVPFPEGVFDGHLYSNVTILYRWEAAPPTISLLEVDNTICGLADLKECLSLQRGEVVSLGEKRENFDVLADFGLEVGQ